MQPNNYSVRNLFRSLMTRPRRPDRRPAPRLGLTPLEDRVVPAFQDVGGLRFDIPGTFTTAADGGFTKYSSTEVVSVGLAPQGASTFVPLFTLADGGSVLDKGDASSPFTWTDKVQAVTSGSPLTLFSGASESQTVAETLPDATASATRTPSAWPAAWASRSSAASPCPSAWARS